MDKVSLEDMLRQSLKNQKYIMTTLRAGIGFHRNNHLFLTDMIEETDALLNKEAASLLGGRSRQMQGEYK